MRRAIDHGMGRSTIVEHEGTRQHGLKLHIAGDVHLLVGCASGVLNDELCGFESEVRLFIIPQEFR